MRKNDLLFNKILKGVNVITILTALFMSIAIQNYFAAVAWLVAIIWFFNAQSKNDN